MGNECSECIESNDSNMELPLDSKINALKMHYSDYQLNGSSSTFVMDQDIHQIRQEQLKTAPLQVQGHCKGEYSKGVYIPAKSVYYEGQWKEKRPHGKGKAYFDTGEYYQGYFKNGAANSNDGILIFPDKSVYRGQIYQSKMEGKGVYKHYSGKFQYSGRWRNNRPDGWGQQTYADGSTYEGHFQAGIKNGKGVYKWKDGRVCRGEFRQGYLWGQGEIYKKNSVNKGVFVKNKRIGEKIKMKTAYGEYEGPLLEGKMHGYGIFRWDDGKIYKGQFMNGKLHGVGQIIYPNGQIVKGIWEKGENDRVNLIMYSPTKKQSSQ